jgi:uroporphyrinogen-III synthase
MPDLSGVTVVVTRPAHQAERLCQSIETAGGTALRFPVIEIRPPSNPKQAQSQLKQLNSFDLAVFISTNAVASAFDLLGGLSEPPPGWPPKVAIAAVGQATAKAITSQGLAVNYQTSKPYNSEALLNIPELQALRGKRILILRGEGGREYLAKTLRERGAEVEYAECYQRAMPGSDPAQLYNAWNKRRPLLFVVTSNEGLENLFQMIDAEHRTALLASRLIVMSERAVALADKLGFAQTPVVVSAVSNEAILLALKSTLRSAPKSGIKYGQ